jgi:hypothetical protein
MPKTLPQKLHLLNTKSFFDTCIGCPAAFDIEIVQNIEAGNKSSNPNPPQALEYISQLLLSLDPLKPSKIGEAMSLYRTTLFYLVLMMDYCYGDMELLMMIQLLALQISDMYCELLDIAAKTNPILLRQELDKCTTFQNSANCVTPNIIKENFLESVKTKEVVAYIKAKFVDVDFQEDLDSDDIEELETEFAEQDKQLQTIFEQMEQSVVKSKKNPRKSKSK